MSYGHDKDDFKVKDSGERIDYQSGMRRDTQKGKPNYRLIDLGFLRRLANHLTKGAEKYGRDNWRLADSVEELDRFKDSAFRHLMQWLGGDRDEDHGMAVVFNIMAAEHTAEKMENKKEPKTKESNSPLWKIWEEAVKASIRYDWNLGNIIKTEATPSEPNPPIEIDLYRVMKRINGLVVDDPVVTVELRSGGKILVFSFIWPKHQARYMIDYYELAGTDHIDIPICGMVLTINEQYLQARKIDLQNSIRER